MLAQTWFICNVNMMLVQWTTAYFCSEWNIEWIYPRHKNFMLHSFLVHFHFDLTNGNISWKFIRNDWFGTLSLKLYIYFFVPNPSFQFSWSKSKCIKKYATYRFHAEDIFVGYFILYFLVESAICCLHTPAIA